MIKNKDAYFTCAEVAQSLGFTPDYVRRLIRKGTLKGEKIGASWVVHQKNMGKLRRQRAPHTKDTKDTKHNGTYK